MLRRTVGEHFWLIRQSEHARLSADIARAITPANSALIQAIERHDDGWNPIDDLALTNTHHQPLDVFEAHWRESFNAWNASSTLAYERWLAVTNHASSKDSASLGLARQAMLISLHGLSLSAYSATKIVKPRDQTTSEDLLAIFQLNKYQHKELERQEALRTALGLSIDLPTTFGLVDTGLAIDEDLIRHELRLFQACDVLSLALCEADANSPNLTGNLTTTTTDIHPQPGSIPVTLRWKLLHPQPNLPAWGSERNPIIMHVSPWIFGKTDQLQLSAQAALVPAAAYISSQQLLATLSQANAQTLHAAIIRET